MDGKHQSSAISTTGNNPGSSRQATSGSGEDEDLLSNELRSHRNRGFHDGYDAGRNSTMQKAFDEEYERAFERSFALSTLKGIAKALRTTIECRATPPDSPDGTQAHSLTSLRWRDVNSTPSSSNSALESSTISSFADLETSTSDASHMVLARAEARYFGLSLPTGKPAQHLSDLDKLDFDNAKDIAHIKKVLKTICWSMQMEILAHYVEQIG